MASIVVQRQTSTTIVELTRPWFWPLSWAPLWYGTALATGSWVPDLADLVPFLAALVVMGPLVWGSVCSINDLHDVETDRRNLRKGRGPLVKDHGAPEEVGRWHARLSIAALAVALLVGPLFALGTAGVLALGWAYSVPPVRLKSRPGLDVLANALTVGVLAPVAGWSLHRPIIDYPLPMVLLGLALAAALYLPTLVLDLAPDAAAGIHTFAVRWGARTSYRLGLLLWTSATLGWLALLAGGTLGTGGFSWPQEALVALPLVVYAVLTRRPSIPRMAVVCVSFCLPAGDFLIHLQHSPIGA